MARRMAVDWPSWWLVLLSLEPPLLKLCLHLLDLFALRSPQLQMLHFFSLALQPIRVLVWFAFPLFLCSGSWFSGLMESGVCLDNCSILTLIISCLFIGNELWAINPSPFPDFKLISTFVLKYPFCSHMQSSYPFLSL